MFSSTDCALLQAVTPTAVSPCSHTVTTLLWLIVDGEKAAASI